ncbi:MAG: hypothetical protein DSY42_09340 [Aquifex sp.]|nr:MAG: hypothetical protein DSY42_09340 [Aquifex sp.]
MLEEIYTRSFSVLSKIFSFPVETKREIKEKERSQKGAHKKPVSVKNGQRAGKSRKVSIFELLLTKSVEEIAKDIGRARDKAWNGEPLSSYEKFLFDAFLDMGNSTLEDLAKSLKAKAKRYGV